MDPIEQARLVIATEARAVRALGKRIGLPFRHAVAAIYACAGRVIVTGMGKSGIVAQKIASTLSSTGTPAIFLHPGEALHGDLGIVNSQDVVLAVSKSGQTDELSMLFPVFKRLGVKIITLTGDPASPLAQASDVVLDVSVKEEACPFNLVPTASSTAALVMGDALAIALLSRRRFRVDDFARLHPGGTIGRQLLYRVKDLMLGGKDVPVVREEATMKEAILEMTAKRGITGVADSRGRLVGVITDGDLRRMLEKEAEGQASDDVFSVPVKRVMNRNPKTIRPEELALEAARLMETHRVTALLVVTRGRKPAGVIHLHDLMRARVV
jgi:arabinose-5-phosphate isomerase